MSEWKSIETAPKDARACLVFCPVYRNIYVVTWVVPLGNGGERCVEDGFWAHFANGSSPLRETPSHWMPLPEPPK